MKIKNCNHNSWSRNTEQIDDHGNCFVQHKCNKCNVARVCVVAKIAGHGNIAQTCIKYRWDDFPKPWNYYLNNFGPHANK